MAEDLDQTLVFPRTDKKVLLAMKKRGFGEGRWNGMGGKLKPGETFEEAAVRETLEEVGLVVATGSLVKIAKLKFIFPSGQQLRNQTVMAYETREWEGEPVESEEMDPKWFQIQSLPLDKMWPDDKLWLPGVLNGLLIRAEIVFDSDDQVLDFSMSGIRRSAKQ